MDAEGGTDWLSSRDTVTNSVCGNRCSATRGFFHIDAFDDTFEDAQLNNAVLHCLLRAIGVGEDVAFRTVKLTDAIEAGADLGEGQPAAGVITRCHIDFALGDSRVRRHNVTTYIDSDFLRVACFNRLIRRRGCLDGNRRRQTGRQLWRFFVFAQCATRVNGGGCLGIKTRSGEERGR